MSDGSFGNGRGERLITAGLATATAAILVVFGVQALAVWACGPNACREDALPAGILLIGAVIAIGLAIGLRLIIEREHDAGRARLVLAIQTALTGLLVLA